MKRSLILIVLSLALVLCFAACDTPTEDPVDTTEEITTEAPATEQTTEEITTEEPTTEEITTEEATTEALLQTPVNIEDVKAAAITFVGPEMIKTYAENPDKDWSDFGGMTVNEDGSVKALYRYGADDHWDPYCYLVKDYVAAGNIAVIQYRSEYNFGVNLYIGSEGNVATGPSEHVQAHIFATKDGEWNYLVVNLKDDAMCYDNDSGVLGFLRFGLDDAEAGDTIDFGFVAFFANITEAANVLPISLPEE